MKIERTEKQDRAKKCFSKIWTESAIDCYKRGCICPGCTIEGSVEEGCYMKKVVLELVRVLGTPPEKEEKKNEFSELQKKMIELVREGMINRDLIADELKTTRCVVNNNFSQIFRKLKKKGYVFSKNQRAMYGELIDYINEGLEL